MAKILKSFLYIVLVLLVLAAFAAGLFLLAWWAGWPLTSVMVIPLAAVALLLVVFGIRRLWQWKNRRTYVRTVLREDPSRIAGTPEGVQDSALQRAWNRGMQYFGHLPASLGQSTMYRNPWVMVLGNGQSNAHALASCQARVFDNHEANAPLHWHFLPDTVLLELSPALLENGETGNNWEGLLAKLSTTRTKEPINGFVVVVSARELAETAIPQQSDAMRALAITIRSRIDDVLTILPARVPVRIVVTGLETMPAVSALASRLGRKTTDQWLGCEFAPPAIAHETIQNLGNNGSSAALAVHYALESAKNRLRRILIEEAGQGIAPDGDDLSAQNQLETLHDGLALFVEALLRPSAIPSKPFLRGIHFSAFVGSTETPQAAKAVFANELLRRFPADRNLAVGVNRPSLRDIPLSMAYAGACLLLLALCTCFTSNVLHSHRVLGGQQAPVSLADIPASLKEAASASARLRQLVEAEKFWWLPSFGLNRVPDEIARLQAVFVNEMRHNLLPAFLAECKPGQGGDFPYAALQHLLWMQEMIDGVDREKAPFPVEENSTAPQQSAFWNLSFGRLYLDFLDWSQPADKSAFRDRLTATIKAIVGQDEENIFNHVLKLVNANTPQWDIPISRFWANAPRGSKKFTAIAPAYTAVGYTRLCENMQRLMDNTGRSFKDAPYWKQYLGDYERMWAEFVSKSDLPWNDLDRVDSLLQIAVKPASKDDPYVRLMQTVVLEFQPLRADGVSPQWVEDLALLQALWRVGELANPPQGVLGDKELPGTAVILWNAATKLQAVDLEVLRSRLADVNKLTPLVDAVKAIESFRSAVEELFQTSRDTEGSLELARIEFGGKDYGDPATTATTKARKALNDIATVLGFATQRGTAQVRRDGTRSGQEWNASPAQWVFGGPLRFLQYLAGCHAAFAIQQHWESDILPQTALLPPDSDSDALFGAQGLVNKFLGEQLKPFLAREVGSFKARNAHGTTFPFTPDFLSFLQAGQMAQSHPKKDSYEVPIKTSTASLNGEALEHLQYYELKLAGTEGAQVLRNSNYPLKGKFTYSEKNCGGVTLEISFPSLTLRFGYDSFPSFLEDFAHGERIFTADDFPDAEERMEALKIQQITIRILAQNSLEILETFKDEIIIPSRITGVW